MTLAYTCVLIAIIMPLVWAMYCKIPHFKANDYDNNSPRPMLDKLDGPYQRANWAQQNSYESLPPFLAAVIIAHLVGVSQGTIDTLAVIYVVARFAFGVLYIKDLASLRSMSWMVGFFSVIGLFVASYMAG